MFTAGVGEHSSQIRALVCDRMAWLGVVLDEGANLANATVISAPASRVEVRVIPTDEEATIARHTFETLSQRQGFAGASDPRVSNGRMPNFG